MDPSLISCDWGSTSFRLRAVTVDGQTLAERVSEQGASVIGTPGLTAAERETLFSSTLAAELAALGEDYAGLPVCVSGMATSAHGWVELPYAMAPVPLDGSGLVSVRREVAGHPVTLVSGVRTERDVMRGEECELLGLLRSRPELARGEVLVLLPGTHAKHVRLIDGQLCEFETAMTGELFALLREHSVLRHSFVEVPGAAAEEFDADEVFRQGLRDCLAGSLLGILFQVRTRALLRKAGPKECAAYLNGVLLGDELRGASLEEWDQIVVCAPPRRAWQYRNGIEEIGIGAPVLVPPEPELNRLVVLGHLAAMG